MPAASRCIGHVIAGNTPLLAWTSLLRALLMRSASVVKLPSGDAAEWGQAVPRLPGRRLARPGRRNRTEAVAGRRRRNATGNFAKA